MRPELPAPQCVVLQQICRAVLHDAQHADFKRTRRQIVDHHGSQKQRGSLPGHRDIPLHLPLPVTAELDGICTRVRLRSVFLLKLTSGCTPNVKVTPTLDAPLLAGKS